ncbi:TonB-dependent receptor, partial [Mycobacterium tuberculosis]
MGNAGSARSQGAELSLMVRPAERLTLGLNAAYIDSKIGDVPASSGLVSGSRMPMTPRLSWSSTIDYDFDVSDQWQGRVGAGYRV